MEVQRYFALSKVFYFLKCEKTAKNTHFSKKLILLKFNSNNFPGNFFMSTPVHKEASIKFSGNSTVKLLRKLRAKMLVFLRNFAKNREIFVEKTFWSKIRKIHQNTY